MVAVTRRCHRWDGSDGVPGHPARHPRREVADQMTVKRDLLLPILTGILAIMLERRLFNRSAAARAFAGAES